ncbi:MAG: DUF1508 domain-containing protein [Theionarchaea archaeon]|nr:DUF1508 domain-containing protein [Theionarchaea archaeon]DBA34795.1 TPA_asm: hypothetical protein vir521_00001 [Caudoviricetes sp. vir521]
MRIEIFRTHKGEYCWRLKADNGEIMCESYHHSTFRDRAELDAQFVKEHIKEAEVIYLD